jgi:DNA-binding CsgD family transcriptional regulator/2-hydroxychromene-2-carboxylate isomerase
VAVVSVSSQQPRTCKFSGEPFVGYAEYLAALRSPQYSAVFIFGEPGIGKSRLLAEARRESDNVFYVGCLPAAASIPLEAVVSLIQRMHRQGYVPAKQWRRVREAREKDRLMYGREALEAALHHGPFTVQIDDLQWAHRDTLDALSYYIDRLQDSPLNWHLAARCGTLLVEAAADKLVRANLAASYVVDGFDAHELRAFIRALNPNEPVDDVTVSRVKLQTAGNPLYVEALLRSTEADDGKRFSGIQHLLKQRFNCLSSRASQIAGWLAAHEGNLQVEEIAALCRTSRDKTQAALEELVRLRIFERAGNGYGFRHLLLREAFYERLDERVRARRHNVLALHSADDWQKAKHFRGAGQLEAARSLLVKLGWRRIEAYASAEARAAFEQALLLCEPHSTQAWEARAGIAAALFQNGEHAEGRRLIPELDANINALPAGTRVLARTWIADSAPLDVSTQAAKAALAEAHAARQFIPRLCCILAHTHERRNELPAAEEILRQGIACCSQENVADVAALNRWLGVITARQGNRALGVALLESAAALSADHKLDEELAKCCTCLAYVYSLFGAMVNAEKYCKIAANLHGPLSKQTVLVVLTDLGAVAAEQGHLREAISLQSRAIALTQAASGTGCNYAFANQSINYAVLGDFENADASLANAVSLSASKMDRCVVNGIAGVVAEIKENYRLALSHYQEAAHLALSVPDYIGAAKPVAGVMRAAFFVKDRDSAKAAFLQLRMIEKGQYGAHNSFLLQAEGYWKLLNDDASGCDTLLKAASITDGFRAARIRLTVATVRQDRKLLLEVIEAFDKMGAVYFARRAREIAHSFGFRVNEKRRSKDNLSERELSVARLIAGGHTNAEIAQTLGVSVRTVESHITSILGRRGLRSRVQIATTALN